MPINRSLSRNVTFYDATKPNETLGGLIQNGSITEANFLDILGILLVVEGSPIRVQERISSRIVSRTDMPLETGVYDIYCNGMYYNPLIYSLAQLLILLAAIQVSNEPWIPRSVSYQISSREDNFCHEIRFRDRKCVISGVSVPEIHIKANNWAIFEAAYIFPLQHESHWVQYNYGRWMTDMHYATGSSRINSIKNGFLLREPVHTMFDRYLISVNPDDGHKVVAFDTDVHGYDGRILGPVCRNQEDHHYVSKEILTWHFRQSVLANVRGAGEPIFEHDFPPGTDMVGEILAGPYARERFELEIAARLREVP